MIYIYSRPIYTPILSTPLEGHLMNVLISLKIISNLVFFFNYVEFFILIDLGTQFYDVTHSQFNVND